MEECHFVAINEEACISGVLADKAMEKKEDDEAEEKLIEEKVIDMEGSANLWTLENLAIPLTYMCVGFLNSFPNAYIQYYPRSLGASDSQLSTIGTVRSLPWSFKLLYGFCADAFPFRGYRFKPYMFIGYIISSCFNAAMAYVASPSVITFTLLLLGSMFGLILADVMADALTILRAKRETKTQRGSLQSTVYMCRFASEVVGYWVGSILCNREEWNWGLTLAETFIIMACVPWVLVFPALVFLQENPLLNIESVSHQVKKIWTMMQMRAVWQPLGFIIFFNSFGTYNAAWGNYLQVAYHFSAFEYGSMAAVGALVCLLGLHLYKTFGLKGCHWRKVYFYTTVVMVVFAILNILLVFRVNDTLGISAYWFAMGDNAVQYLAYGIQYLPTAVMWVTVCPDGQEAIAFSLLTGFTNLSSGVASTISNILLGIWPVQLETLSSGDYSGVWKLTILSNCINLIPLFFLYYLPSGIDQLEQWKCQNSLIGARCLLSFLIFGSIWVVTTSMLAITTPCLQIVGGEGCH